MVVAVVVAVDWNRVWSGMGQVPDKFRDFEKWSAGMDPEIRNKLTKVTHWHMVLLGTCLRLRLCACCVCLGWGCPATMQFCS